MVLYVQGWNDAINSISQFEQAKTTLGIAGSIVLGMALNKLLSLVAKDKQLNAKCSDAAICSALLRVNFQWFFPSAVWPIHASMYLLLAVSG